jgi:hypothetical protein
MCIVSSTPNPSSEGGGECLLFVLLLFSPFSSGERGRGIEDKKNTNIYSTTSILLTSCNPPPLASIVN